MATGLHKDLLDAELHEAKGAAGATAGHVLTADGAGAATFQALPAASAFGDGFLQAENAAIGFTTSVFFQQHLSLNIPAAAAGNYRIEWYWEWGHLSTTADFEMKCELDNADVLGIIRQPTHSGLATERKHASGFAFRALNGAHDIDIDYRSVDNVSTGGIWVSRIHVYRVS